MTFTAAFVDGFSGMMNLYRDINYRHQLVLFTFSKSNRCFNMACGVYYHSLSSVKWSGLPLTASYAGSSSARLVFYDKPGCKGASKSFKTSRGKIKSFVTEGFNDLASSFMVLESSKKIENGISSLCRSESSLLDESLNTTNSTET
ncbi:hypothetical protein P3T76_014153 [Phytophthora citrophthora]|uniref:Uncharacterized protein n=1 Tax=Phytophthora citrophthora TaxID=4793 RepID=A0AAD9G200_9STRA|nr:hypothetical protein P3T76_014153 [Phytophthora citrophthora]